MMGGCTSATDRVAKQPVVQVNSAELSTLEFSLRLGRRLRNHDSLSLKDQALVARAKEDVIQGFIIETLVNEYARSNSILLDEARVTARVEEVRKGFPDDLAFRRSLADENLTMDDWRADIGRSILQKQIFDHLVQGLPAPTEAELKAEYERTKSEFVRAPRVKLRQIVVPREEDAKKVMDQLAAGRRLADLARSLSVAPEAENGGETDWIEKGVLDVFDIAFKMPVGGRSKILKSPYGWHIYDVLKREPESRLSFDSARPKLQTQLREQAGQRAFADWLEAQIRRSRVLRNEDLIRSISVSTKAS
jgi:peptidyl-prolyl cis-trans isomerase C